MAAITSAGSGTWSSTTPNAPWPSGTVPGAGDTVIISAGNTVTIDQAATLNIGADSATAAINLSTATSILQYTSTATNSLTLNCKGDITGAGQFYVGTLANPIPSTRTATIQLNNSSALADGKYGWKPLNNAIINTFGASKTLSTTLTADVAANATTFTVADVTGWQVGDTLAIGSTTRTPADAEIVTIASIATLTITVAVGTGTGGNTVKNAHGGGGTTMNGTPITARVINLTCNVKVTSSSTTAAGFITAVSGVTWASKYTEFSYIGVAATNQHGLEFVGTGQTATFCTFHDTRNYGMYIATTTGSNTMSNNVAYNLNTQVGAATNGVTVVATSGANTLDSNVFIAINVPTGGTCISLLDAGGTFTNNIINSGAPGGNTATVGLSLGETAGAIGTFTGNTITSCAGIGFVNNSAGMTGNIGTTANPLTAWRNGAAGWSLVNVLGKCSASLKMFENGTQNVLITSAQFNLLIHDSALDSGSVFATTSNINFTTSSKLMLQTCTLGTGNAATQDILVSANITADVTCFYCSTLTTTFTANALQSTCVRQQNFGQVVGNVKSVYGVGTITMQTTTRHTASGNAWQCTPSSALRALTFPGPTVFDTFKVAVLANVQVTVSIWVLYDASYNGATMPQLILVGGILQGIASDVVATAPSAQSGVWQQLTVQGTPTESGVAEVYCSVVGTAGNAFFDDSSDSQP